MVEQDSKLHSLLDARRADGCAGGWQHCRSWVAAIALVAFLLPAQAWAQTAEVWVRSNVPDATVWVDGRQVGQTNADGELLIENLAADSHTIEVRKPGYWRAVTRTSLVEDLTNTVTFELAPRPADVGSMVVLADVPAATAFFDGRQVGTTDEDGRLVLSDLTPGEYRLGLRKEGVDSTSRIVTVSGGGQEDTVRMSLRGARVATAPGASNESSESPQPEDSLAERGSTAVATRATDSAGVDTAARSGRSEETRESTGLVVSTNVAEAAVYLDGIYSGQTTEDGDLEITADSGLYEVAVKKADYVDVREQVHVRPGEKQTMNFVLLQPKSPSFSSLRSPIIVGLVVAGVIGLVLLTIRGAQAKSSARPLLSSGVSLQDQSLWFGSIELYESHLRISGWGRGRYDQRIDLTNLSLVETWDRVNGPNMVLHTDDVKLPLRIEDGIMLWHWKMREQGVRVVGRGDLAPS